MAKKVAGFFAKKGNKALASHEYREAAGKEKDTPAIAKREMKALKGAPADMKNYEAKEHKAMGMCSGGMTKKYAKGGGVEAKGKTQGKAVRMAFGGMPTRMPAGPVKGPMNPGQMLGGTPSIPVKDMGARPTTVGSSVSGYGGGDQGFTQSGMGARPAMVAPAARPTPVGTVGVGMMAKGGSVKKYATGGSIPKPPPGKKYDSEWNDWNAAKMEEEMEKGTEKTPRKAPPAPKPKAYAKGGMVRGDGCASRGKTKGRFI